MIPALDKILDMYRAGECTREQALNWIYDHIEIMGRAQR